MPNQIKTYVLEKAQITCELHNDGSVSVESVVTHGNFIEKYNGRLSFDSVEKMLEWANRQYN